MRKRIAIAISVATVALLAGLSVLFALRQNPDPVVEPALEQLIQESDSAGGYRVFRALGCERCHAVRGVGSPRYPLDGVGSRRGIEELRAWTIGAPTVQDSLSPSAVRAKQRYTVIPADEMRVLLVYLGALVEQSSD